MFFDEIDALAGTRGGGGGGGGSDVQTRVVSQLLHELDGVSALKQVVVVAATNRPDLLDPAFRRPGRIDRMLYIGPPDAKQALRGAVEWPLQHPEAFARMGIRAAERCAAVRSAGMQQNHDGQGAGAGRRHELCCRQRVQSC